MATQYVYTLTFSDPSKTNTIVVPGTANGTGKNNYDTSLDLVGPGYIGYGNSVAQNFVKLLENFAGPTPPAHPIEGQLWYDTSDPERKILRVNNGDLSSARWPSANGVYQQSTDPTAQYLQNVIDGDIWVDTHNNQLKIRSGTSWTVVGPSTSATENKSGVEVQVLEATTGDTYPVILNWIDGKVVEILSYYDFTPRLVIDGFSTLKPGANLTSKVLSRFNGLADRASSLEISRGVVIRANEVLKNKIPTGTKQVHTGTLYVESIDGLTVKRNSTAPGIKISADSNSANIAFAATTGTFRLGLTNNAYIAFNAQYEKVGINTTASSLLATDPTLTVNGGAQFSNTVTIALSTTSKTALSITGKISAIGDASVTGNLSVSGTVTAVNTLTVSNISASTSTAVIGSTGTLFDNIFVKHINSGTTHFMSLYGRATEATRLETKRDFVVSGVITSTSVAFDGTASVALVTTVTSALITATNVTTVTTASQTLLVANTGTAGNPLYHISKSDFLADIYANIFVTGMMLPYGGLAANVPTGWLVCTTGTNYTDARAVKKSDYLGLFSLIGLRYSSSTTAPDEFQLPTTSTFVTTGTNTGTILPYIIKI